MIINLIDNDETDWEYDSQISWWLSYLKKDLPNIYRIPSAQKDLSIIDDKNKFILFVKGNENHKLLDQYYNDKRVIAVIKNYPYLKNYGTEEESSFKCFASNDGSWYHITEKEDKRTLNLPLGFCNGFTPLNRPKRELSIFFSGHWTYIREVWFNNFFDKLDPNKVLINMYKDGFGGVENHTSMDFLSREDYATCLGNSYIALCPQGHSAETYRLAEAAMSGCVIISNPLPFLKCYQKLPGLKLPHLYLTKNIKGELISESTNINEAEMNKKLNDYLDSSIKNILENFDTFSTLSVNWYNLFISPKSISKQIISHVEAIS